jgi:hypothetical protein
MNERRAELRFMCSDLVTVELENHGQTVVANLEDISPSGARLEMQLAVHPHAKMVLHCDGRRFRGEVRYCVFQETGYQVGIQLTECKWSKENYEPKHLLQAPVVHAGDLVSLIQDDAKSRRLLADLTAAKPYCDEELDRVRVVARAVAWTCEDLSPEDIKQCFSRWFQLPPESSLCDEFRRAYHDEYAVVSSQPVAEKFMAAGSHREDI